MKKTITLLALALLSTSINSQAQELKKTKKSFKKDGYKEFYHVLKQDKTIKHGAYKKTDLKGRTLETGFYKSNVKDSIWNIYIPGTNLVKSQGYYKNGYKDINWVNFGFDQNNVYRLISFGDYKNGEKAGIWEYKNSTNNTFLTANYSDNKILKSELKSSQVEYYTNNSTNKVTTDHPAFYDGGLEVCNQTVTISSKGPMLRSLNSSNSNKEVLISFIVDENGIASDHKIEKSVSLECDETAYKAVKSIPNRWVPARVNGKFVESKFVLPVTVKTE